MRPRCGITKKTKFSKFSNARTDRMFNIAALLRVSALLGLGRFDPAETELTTKVIFVPIFEENIRIIMMGWGFINRSISIFNYRFQRAWSII